MAEQFAPVAPPAPQGWGNPDWFMVSHPRHIMKKNVCRAYHSPSNMKKLACNMFKTMVLIRYGRLYHNVNPNRRGNLISSIPQCESKRNWCNSMKKYVNGLRTIPFMGKGSIFWPRYMQSHRPRNQSPTNHTMWCPSLLAKLVHSSNVTMVYGRYICTYLYLLWFIN